MSKKIAAALALLASMIGHANADTFVNGNFETGTLAGWTTGGGYNYGATNNLNPADYLPGGSKYNASAAIVNVTTSGTVDAITGASTTYNGNYAVKVNDATPYNGVSVITQTVSNYQDSQIAFAWNAVLQSSHGVTDSDAFNLTLVDNTTNTTLYAASFSSATVPGIFTAYGSWYSSGWQTQTIDVSALQGHSFTLSLLATDCEYSAHAGYVYLDGFGGSVPTPGPVTPSVPEPESYAMFLAGLGVVGGLARRRHARQA